MKGEISKALILLTLTGLQPQLPVQGATWVAKKARTERPHGKNETTMKAEKKPVKVLLTGFQPFSDPVNVSELTMQQVDTAACCGLRESK